jgi:hypothetical protein
MNRRGIAMRHRITRRHDANTTIYPLQQNASTAKLTVAELQDNNEMKCMDM